MAASIGARSLTRSRLLASGSHIQRISTRRHFSQSEMKAAGLGAGKEGHGAAARTDKKTHIPHPGNGQPTKPTRGQGGTRLQPTLASFSLEGKSAIVTGAGGLGLVMAQGLMTSGADVAIVDLNCKSDGHAGLEQL
jgi:hypothetical protein